jgi:EAL domain-containing protein (putative c-di-GMP-specific phosphodiesterase class I)
MPVAVSVATGQVTDYAFVGEVAEILPSAGLEPRMLEVSVTEDVLLYDFARGAHADGAAVARRGYRDRRLRHA